MNTKHKHLILKQIMMKIIEYTIIQQHTINKMNLLKCKIPNTYISIEAYIETTYIL